MSIPTPSPKIGRISQIGGQVTENSGLESNCRQTTISAVSKVEQIGAELQNLSRTELAQLRILLDDLLEDELEFTPEFQSTLEQSEQEKSKGARPRTRQV